MKVNVSRRLTPTSVYKLQSLASEEKARAKRNKKKFNPAEAARKLAERFKLPEESVSRLVRA